MGAEAAIDATIWNVYIRSRIDRDVIGPPIVFRIRTVRGGMLLGLCVSLENANWISAASAIDSCLADKTQLCARHGIEISPDDWPVKGLPGSIQADGGETKNTRPKRFIQKTNCQLQNKPSFRPDLRGGSESDWNTLQVQMNGETAGAVVGKWQERSGSDWKIQGTMDIDEFTRALLKHELRRMKTPQKGVKLTAEMIAAGVDGSPLSIWNYSMSAEGGSLMQFNREDVQLSLMEIGKASIRPDGIYFKGMLYRNPQFDQDGTYLKLRRSGKNKSIDVAFDRRLVDSIHIYTPDQNHEYSRCDLNLNFEAQRALLGKSFAEVERLFDKDAANRAADVQARRQSAVNFQASQEQDAQASAEATRKATPTDQSKTAAKAGIRVNRQAERDAHSPSLAFDVGKPPSTDTPRPQDSVPAEVDTSASDEEQAAMEALIKRFG